MPRAKISPTIELEYDTFGDSKNPALVLIEGHGAQMVKWDPEYCKMFVAKNLFVIRFDNRDCGLSTKFDGIEVDLGATLTAALLEEPVPPVPYTLSDMASDVVGLLDSLKIDRAHIFGVSLGGGHNGAAGAKITKDKLDEFLKYLEVNVVNVSNTSSSK